MFKNIVVTIITVGFLGTVLFLPQIGLANDSQISLSEGSVWDLLNIIQGQIKRTWESLYVGSSPFTPEEEAAIFLVRDSIQKRFFGFWTTKLTEEIAKAYLKAILFLYATPPPGDIINKIESESKEAALKYLEDWISQNEVKTASGELNYSYEDYNKIPRKVAFQYVITYSPIEANRGEVAVEFYSIQSTYPPFPEGSLGGVSGFPWDFSEWLKKNEGTNKKTLDPFIIQAKIGVKKVGSSYLWDETMPTEIEVEFPEVVPDIRPEEPSLAQKIRNIFDTVKGLASEFSLWINAELFDKLFEGSELFEVIDLSRLEEIGRLITGAREAQKTSSEIPGDLVQLNSGQPIEILEVPLTQGEVDGANSQQLLQQEKTVEVNIQSESQRQEGVSWCNPIGQTPAQKKIVFNEIAWMGTVNSSNDEWMELKNISGKTVNLSNWQLFDEQKQIKIIFDDTAFIPASGFYLLERTDDNSVPYLKADLIYSGSLGNADEAFYLFDANCQLQDMVSTDSAWPAGNNLNTEKRTMERNSNLQGWHTYSGYQNNGIWGTPKAENSPTLIESTEASNSNNLSGGGSSGGAGYGISYTPPQILITEIQIEGESKQHDFFEIYNPNQYSVDISNWKLRKRNQNGTESSLGVFPQGTTILANSYFLWANGEDENYPGLIQADISFRSYYLADNNSIAVFDHYDNVIDAVAWGSGLQNPFFEKSPFNQNPGKFQSLERKVNQAGSYIDNNDNLNDFQLSDCPNPKGKVVACYPSSVPVGGGGSPPLSYPKILISEIQISPTDKRFIELYNPTNDEVNLIGWYIQRKTKTGTSWNSLVSSSKFEDEIIQPGSHFLIARSSILNPDILLDLTLTEDNAILLKNPNKEIVNMVGWGEAQDFETSPTKNPLPNQTIGRKPIEDKYQDTDNNSEDFEIQNPTPGYQNISPPPPQPAALEVSPLALEFSLDSPPKYLSLFNSGNELLEWQTVIEYTSPQSDGLNWLGIEPSSGQILGETVQNLEVSQYLFGLPEGEYRAKIIVDAGAITGSPEEVEVILEAADDTPPEVSFNLLPSVQRESIFDLSWWSQDVSSGNLNGISFVSPSGIDGFLLTYIYDVTPATDGVTLALDGLWYFDSGDWRTWLRDKVLFIRDTFLRLLGKNNHVYNFEIQAKDKAGNLSETAMISTVISLPKPVFKIDPEELKFEGVKFVSTSGDGILTIENLGDANLAWQFVVSSIDTWISLDPISGEVSPGGIEKVLVSVDSSNLEAGQYQTKIEIDSNDNQKEIPVSLDLKPEPLPQIKITYPEDGQIFLFPETEISIRGEASPRNYISISDSCHQAQADENGDWEIGGVDLNSGQNILNLIARNQSGEETTATLAVISEAPILEVMPAEFKFKTLEDENPKPQSLTIKNIGNGNLGWEAENLAFWLSLQSKSGTVPANSSSSVEILVDIFGLEPGEYQDTLEIKSSNASNSPQRISMNLTIGTLIENATTIWPGDFGYSTVRGAEVILKPGEYNFKDLILEDGAKLILESNLGLDFLGFRGVKIIAENMEVCDDCAISADGKGYPAGQGPGTGEIVQRCFGYGCAYRYWYGSGAGYGGEGGDGNNGAESGNIYGSLIEPEDLGSGGASDVGSAGGGAILIEVTDALEINGIISANGENEDRGHSGSTSLDRGGGSGGSIYIKTNILTGEGLISVYGGKGAPAGGGGGGGRIAIEGDVSGFGGEIRADGGTGYQNGEEGTRVINGEEL